MEKAGLQVEVVYAIRWGKPEIVTKLRRAGSVIVDSKFKRRGLRCGLFDSEDPPTIRRLPSVPDSSR